MQKSISVLIADDNKLFANNLAEFLKVQPGIRVAGVAYDGEEAYGMIVETKPDVALIDVVICNQNWYTLLHNNSPFRILIIIRNVSDKE